MDHLLSSLPGNPSVLQTEGFSSQAALIAEAFRLAAQAVTTAAPAKAVPIAELIESYRQHQLADGVSAKQVRLVNDRLLQLAHAAAWGTSLDISERSLQQALQAIASRPGRRGRERLSRRTLRAYGQAACQLTRWASRPRFGHLASNPLAGWEPLEVRESDQTFWRRALTAVELGRLLTAAETGRSVERISGPDRRALYIAACTTGLRKGELGSLVASSFDFVAGRVTVQANYSKRRRRDTLVLPPDAVDELSRWIHERPARWAGDLLWPISKEVRGGRDRDTAKMLAIDCQAAGIPYEDPQGVVDFHALRHTYVTNLAAAGVPLTTVQRMARHSDPRLTSNVYTHVARSDEEAAARLLPPIRATGTTHVRPDPEPPTRRLRLHQEDE